MSQPISTCLGCSKSLTRKTDKYESVKHFLARKFCGSTCFGLSRVGQHLGGKKGMKMPPRTPVHLARISAKLRGRKNGPLPVSVREKISAAHKRIPHTEEWNRKVSLSQRGPLGNNWQGGKVSAIKLFRGSAEYARWRRSIFERDNYTCVWCNVRGGQLNADHIKPFAMFPELRLSLDNGRTLCVPCHKKTDTFSWKTRVLMYGK